MHFRAHTLGRKISLGYGLIILILAIAIIVTIRQVGKLRASADEVTNLQVPVTTSSLELMNGINHSVAALRGWAIFRDEKFRTERKTAWENEINPSLARLENLIVAADDPAFQQQVISLGNMLGTLQQYQDEAEKVEDPVVMSQFMEARTLPTAFRIKDLLGKMADEQEKLMQQGFKATISQITILEIVGWILLATGTLMGILLAVFITRSITRPVGRAIKVADEIAAGNYAAEVDISGSKETELLGDALTKMRDSLQAKTAEMERYNWLSRGQNMLDDLMRGDRETDSLATDIVSFMAEYTGASAGALFVTSGRGSELVLKGRYSFTPGADLKQTFAFGEGLVGQVAATKNMMMLSDMDEDHLRVTSSMVDAPVRNIIIVPLIFDDHTLGVLELGKFTPFDETTQQFISSVTKSIGITLNSSLARFRIRELLEETQRQSEELQVQHEELTQTNEELEEQTMKLREQQEELQVVNEELEEQTQIVEQKNRALETARLDLELKARQIEISSKYKSEFLANMSHELRTPLNSLLILSNDLASNREKNLSADQVESAQVISRSGHDLLNLINEILDLSKIEAGKMDLNLSDSELQEIADAMLMSFRRLADEKNLRLSVTVEEGAPASIRTDRQRLEQILRNLISNAIKFTEHGSVDVIFRRNTGDALEIVVEDSGIGIAKDKLDVIFEAFQQAEGGTARKYGGTGLGLSISRELARLMGGRITVTSQPGTGSVFTLIIPLSNDGAPEQIRVIPRREPLYERPENETSNHFINFPSIADDRETIGDKDRVILIVEDDINFLRVLAGQAREKGFKYLAASSGEDGLILAEKFLPHAILLDIDLPGMDGHSVLKELKGNPYLRHIPVHIVSVNEKTLDPIKSGAVEYLTKPVSREQLEEAFSRIEDFISRKMKNLLIVEDNELLRRSIVKLIGNGDVKCYEAGSAAEVFETFRKQVIDCMVLDIGLPDMNGFDLIKRLETEGIRIPPIIVYTGRQLSRKENDELREYAETIIVKGVKSEERLLDETALFLHRTVKNLPPDKQDMITGLYDKETIFRDKTILLVDDDMRNVFALSKILKEKGLNVIKAENGNTALEALNQNPDTDLVLMDIMMPEMDGYQCMQEIRRQKQFEDLPIIALTAKAMKEDRQRCIDSGANDYITKPVDVERLLSLMRIWIKKTTL